MVLSWVLGFCSNSSLYNLDYVGFIYVGFIYVGLSYAGLRYGWWV